MWEHLQHGLSWLKKQRINKGVVLIKAFIVCLHLGVDPISGYLTLQMVNMGMDYADVSYISGAIPFFASFASPLAGFIGDMIGYNAVLVVNLLITGVTMSCFDLTPRFKETHQIPTLTVGYNQTSNTSTAIAFYWPLADCTMNVTVSDCLDSPILENDYFWSHVQDFFSCGSGAPITNLQSPDLSDLDLFADPFNGTMCRVQADDASESLGLQLTDYKICNFTDSALTSCYTSEGSHSKTFWVYFALRMTFQMSLIACYAALDGTALRQCKEFKSHYSWMMFYATIASSIAPLIASATIKDAPEGSNEENDYSLAIYVGDGFLFLALLISTKLKVTLRPETDAADDAKSTKDHDKKNEEQQRRKETRNALLKIINPTTLIFFGLVFTNGLVRGVDGTYVSLYLQDELGASSQLLGYIGFVATLPSLLMLPFGQRLIEMWGNINIIYFALVGESFKMVIFATVRQSPPYYAFALAAMNVFVSTLYWVAVITYANKVAPPTLIGTMAALTATVNWVMGTISGFIAGQLIEHTPMTTQQVFLLFAAICFGGASLFYAIYLTIGRKLERKLLAQYEGNQTAKSIDNVVAFKEHDHGKLTSL